MENYVTDSEIQTTRQLPDYQTMRFALHYPMQAAEHLRETQALVAEFNRAQDLLKDKISALQIA